MWRHQQINRPRLDRLRNLVRTNQNTPVVHSAIAVSTEEKDTPPQIWPGLLKQNFPSFREYICSRSYDGFGQKGRVNEYVVKQDCNWSEQSNQKHCAYY